MEMFKISSKSTLIISSLLLTISSTPCAFAQARRAITGPSTFSNPIGILPPRPLPIPVPEATPPPPDSTLFTTYMFYTSYKSVEWMVCGATKQTSGCYDFGTLGPFGKIGAMIEGNETSNYVTNTTTRNLYIVDEAANGGTGVTLYVYQKTDVVTDTFDTTTVTLTNTIPLPLVGGAQAITYLAGNDNFLYIATNQNGSFVQVNKSNPTSIQPGSFNVSPITSITTNKYGYVTLVCGNSFSTSQVLTLTPTGQFTQDGGGTYFMLDTRNGLSVGSSSIISTAIAPNILKHLPAHVQQATP